MRRWQQVCQWVLVVAYFVVILFFVVGLVGRDCIARGLVDKVLTESGAREW